MGKHVFRAAVEGKPLPFGMFQTCFIDSFRGENACSEIHPHHVLDEAVAGPDDIFLQRFGNRHDGMFGRNVLKGQEQEQLLVLSVKGSGSSQEKARHHGPVRFKGFGSHGACIELEALVLAKVLEKVDGFASQFHSQMHQGFIEFHVSQEF